MNPRTSILFSSPMVKTKFAVIFHLHGLKVDFESQIGRENISKLLDVIE